MNTINNIPLIQMVLLLLCAFVMPVVKKPKIYKSICFGSITVAFGLAIALAIHVIQNGAFKYSAGYSGSIFGIQLHIGTIEVLLGLLFTFVIGMITWFSFSSIENEIPQNRVKLYYIMINILTPALLGLVYTNDIFNGYVFIEVSALISCGIIVVKDKKENIKAALKYLIMSTIGSGLILMGIAYIYSYTGHLNIDLIHAEIAVGYQDYLKSILIILALFTAGLGVKSAMFPLHSWLPDAHSTAPTASSALLSGIVLKAFAYFMIKVFFRMIGFKIVNEFNILLIILILGSAGMIYGSISAIVQKDIKKLIAYSSIAQMGYIFFGIGLGSLLGVTIAVYHMIGHAVTKSALFLCAGLMIEQTGSKKLNAYKGLGLEMPITFTLFTLGALSMVGIPILPGFISKWYLSTETISTGNFMFILVILVSSLLNAVYYFPIVISAFFGTDNLDGKVYRAKQVQTKRVFPIVSLIAVMILVGVFSGHLIDWIRLGIITR